MKVRIWFAMLIDPSIPDAADHICEFESKYEYDCVFPDVLDICGPIVSEWESENRAVDIGGDDDLLDLELPDPVDESELDEVRSLVNDLLAKIDSVMIDCRI